MYNFYVQFYKKSKVTYITITTYKLQITIPINIAYNTNNDNNNNNCPRRVWPRGQNPRRYPRSPRVYTYKDKEYLLKK